MGRSAMIMKVSVANEIGGGVSVSFETEIVVDSTDEALSQGEEFNHFTQAFAAGYGGANLDE